MQPSDLQNHSEICGSGSLHANTVALETDKFKNIFSVNLTGKF